MNNSNLHLKKFAFSPNMLKSYEDLGKAINGDKPKSRRDVQDMLDRISSPALSEYAWKIDQKAKYGPEAIRDSDNIFTKLRKAATNTGVQFITSIFTSPTKFGGNLVNTSQWQQAQKILKKHPELQEKSYGVDLFDEKTGKTVRKYFSGKDILSFNPFNGELLASGLDTATNIALPGAGKTIVQGAKAVAKNGVRKAVTSTAQAALKKPVSTVAAAAIIGDPENFKSKETREKEDALEKEREKLIRSSKGSNISEEEIKEMEVPPESKPKILTKSEWLKSYLLDPRILFGTGTGAIGGYGITSIFTDNPWLKGLGTATGGIGGALLTMDPEKRESLKNAILSIFKKNK